MPKSAPCYYRETEIRADVGIGPYKGLPDAKDNYPMKKRRHNKRIRRFWQTLCVLMLCGALLCLWRVLALGAGLDSQQAARRWRGGGKGDFAQISCFVPVDEAVSQSDVYAFRMKLLDQYHAAALDAEGTDGLWVDAWSGIGKLPVSSSRATGEASVIAVGGDFFTLHPLRLLSGSYIGESDLMHDRVLLDEELAWLLFGGIELQGMSLRINGEPFVVAGVIEREQDSASLMAYTAGQGLYMSYDAYVGLTGTENITCYELVSAEPVKGWTAQVARENFKLGRGEVLQNSGRFGLGRLLRLVEKLDSRSMQAMGMIYPYWENAARVTEDRCVRWLLLAILLVLIPAVTAVVETFRLLRRGKDKLEDELLPRLKDNAEEAVRKRQRKRWEKKHGVHTK